MGTKRQNPTAGQTARKMLADAEGAVGKGARGAVETAKTVYGGAASLVPGKLLQAGMSKVKNVLNKAVKK